MNTSVPPSDRQARPADKPPHVATLPPAAALAIFPDHPTELEITKFFEMLGRAISAWQGVEAATYEIYERAIDPGRPGAAAAGFHAIQTYRIKLLVTDQAVLFATLEHPDLRTEWEKLRKRAGKKYERRNDFAHLMAWTYFREAHPNDRMALGPSPFDTRHFLKPAGKRVRPKFRITEITEIGASFGTLIADLRQFSRALPACAARS